MGKRKAESLTTSQSNTKKIKAENPKINKQNLLDDSDASSSDDESVGGVQLEEEPAFKINKEFATRFEHNKKREELQKRQLFSAACVSSNH